MDTFDDARAGHASFLYRNGRPLAAIVPVSAAEAYEAGADTRAALRAELLAEFKRTEQLVLSMLADLRDSIAGTTVTGEPIDKQSEAKPDGYIGDGRSHEDDARNGEDK
jgi:antitoxin (DNA-binding transcriptional repressor) of toxin-antitoxin stability system